jgi:hypothetical protein
MQDFLSKVAAQLGNQKITVFGSLVIILVLLLQANAQAQTSMRRPISPSQPMIMVHADVWNSADPQKIIDLIPADLRPYVVINISLSINHDGTTGAWKTSEYGYEIAKSWLRTAAENRMWATIQPSSGGFSHFPDYAADADLDTTIYGEFFKNYPNFLGINYAEQFWGFDDQWSLTWTERVNHWTALMELTHKYGGYLIVSFTGGFWGAGLNSVAMVKRNPGFAAVLKQYPQNFIMEEKFTMAYGFHDIESTSMGMWLSGYAGHYGIRFDECGWVGNNGESFPVAAGAAPYLEHMMLTGETVVDGPELIWQQSIKSLSDGTTADGFKTRRWEFYPQFENITLDIFRKILDGTIRILSRQEVIDRTKLVIVSDATSGDDRVKYSSPETLFEGLYRMDSDGNYMSNLSWFKKTGRYPAIPTVYQLADDTAQSFQVKVNRTAYATRWPTIASKQTEFNNLFPAEYTGDIYAGRSENAWATYNPYKTGATASGFIPFQYNTCEKIDVTYSSYTVGVIKEFSDKLSIYLANFNNSTTMNTDVLKIYGSTAEPTYTFTERGNHLASTITKSWSGGVLTLNVSHNGPLDIAINCSGTATGRRTSYTAATVVAPATPAIYAGPRQYEAENFDWKSIGGNVTNGVSGAIRNYQGLGYLKFGTNAAARIRDTVKAPIAGEYKLETRYSAAGGNVTTIDLYVNGTKVTTPTFDKTASDGTFAINTQTVTLNVGVNTIAFQANATGSSSVIFDNIVLTSTTPVVATPPTVSITAPAPNNTFTAPAPNNTFTAPATIAIATTAADADGSISHIDFFSNDSLIHSEWTAPYEFDWTDVLAGDYTLRAVAYDNDGNTASDTMLIKVVSTVQAMSTAVRPAGPVTYQVFDMQGRALGTVVANDPLSLRNEIQKAFVKPGCYIVRSPRANGSSIQKVVLEPK